MQMVFNSHKRVFLQKIFKKFPHSEKTFSYSIADIYSSNQIRKTQNEHMIIVCQNLIGIHEFKVNFLFFGCLYCLVFSLKTILELIKSSSDD